MAWKSDVDEIARRKALAKKMGGTESVARHHKASVSIRSLIPIVLKKLAH
jgi:hypothetical protein